MADIFDTEVTTLAVGEGAAYGAALQALWCWQRGQGENSDIQSITKKYVKLNRRTTTQPNPEAVARYKSLQTLQDELSKSLRSTFKKHRRFVLS